MVLGGVREKEKGASRKESGKSCIRCSGAADMQSETETMCFMCSGCRTSNSMKLKNLQICIYKYMRISVILNYSSR